MEKMENRVHEIEVNLEKIGELSPDEMGAWSRFSTITGGRGILSPRGKEVIAVALSVVAKCQWCIPFHVRRALELGAKKQEIIEASWVAVLMGGSPSLMYAQLVLQALEEFEEFEKPDEMMYYPTESARLFQQLLGYVDSVCDEVESKCNSDEARWKLALNIAESDSRIMERLVRKECNNRGWEDPEEFQ
jgi:AhpD family alkylhydroperoxidase